MTNGSKPKVALFLPRKFAEMMFRPEDIRLLSAHAEVLGPVERSDTAAMHSSLKEAVVAVSGWGSARIEGELLASADRLKLIAHSAGSVKGVVSEALFDKGVRVTTAAAANAVPVAQYTVAMMVSGLKQIPWISQSFARGDREETGRRYAVLRELEDIDVGLVGASRVGREVIKLLHAYPRLRIKLYDPYLKPAAAEELGVELTSLDEVCRCPLVSIHAPNIPETRHMFNARTLGLMPDHAVLINTARGALIDETALVAEVRRRPLYAILDVTDPEPPTPDSPMRREPNIILTPHIAGAMNQARCDMGKLAIEETLRFLKGEPLRFEVTKAMLPTQA